MNVFQQQRAAQKALADKYVSLACEIKDMDIDALVNEFGSSKQNRQYQDHMEKFRALCPDTTIANATFTRFKSAISSNNWNMFIEIDIQQSLKFCEEFASFLDEAIQKKKTTLVTSIKPPKPKRAVVKKKAIPAALKRLVWNKHVGEEIGKTKCLCCGVTDITQLAFNSGHITSEQNGGEATLDNLLPVCQNCNSSMGTMNLQEFKDKYKI